MEPRPVQDQRPGLFLPAQHDVARQRLAGRDADPDRRQVGARLLHRVELLGVHRRNAEKDRGAQRLDLLEGHLRRRPAVAQPDRGADPEREGHRVAEAVGVEQLAHREHGVVLPEPGDRPAVALAGADHVAVGVDDALGVPGRTGGIEPETVVHRRCPRRHEIGGCGRGLVPQPVRAVDPQDHRRLFVDRLDPGLDRLGPFPAVDDAGAARILDQEGIVLRPHHGVDRHRDDPRLDGAEETADEVGGVLDHHQYPVARLDSRAEQPHCRRAQPARQARDSRSRRRPSGSRSCRRAPPPDAGR